MAMKARSGEPVSTLEVMNKDSMNMSWSLASRLKLALAAREFFDVENLEHTRQFLKDEVRADHQGGAPGLSLLDFAQYLEAKTIFPKKPNHLRVQHIVARMASLGMLVPVSPIRPGPALFGERYLCFRGMFGEHFRGNLWLAPLLGAELLYEECKSSVVHITGQRKGRTVGGSGVVIHSDYVLTCCHMVEEVELDRTQTFQGRRCALDVNSIRVHSTEDIALIPVKDSLDSLNGAVFRKPIIAQGVYTMGYPRLPNTRDASLTMQQGAVTNERVTSLGGQALFLYSAISRPGNSGGPVLSEDGYVVGMAVEDHAASYESDELFSPHYAGVPADVVVEAVEELAPDIQLVVENLE